MKWRMFLTTSEQEKARNAVAATILWHSLIDYPVEQCTRIKTLHDAEKDFNDRLGRSTTLTRLPFPHPPFHRDARNRFLLNSQTEKEFD